MIVVGIDPHTKTHTAVALEGVAGIAIGELTIERDTRGRYAFSTTSLREATNRSGRHFW